MRQITITAGRQYIRLASATTMNEGNRGQRRHGSPSSLDQGDADTKFNALSLNTNRAGVAEDSARALPTGQWAAQCGERHIWNHGTSDTAITSRNPRRRHVMHSSPVIAPMSPARATSSRSPAGHHARQNTFTDVAQARSPTRQTETYRLQHSHLVITTCWGVMAVQPHHTSCGLVAAGSGGPQTQLRRSIRNGR